jgi:signal peptidase I
MEVGSPTRLEFPPAPPPSASPPFPGIEAEAIFKEARRRQRRRRALVVTIVAVVVVSVAAVVGGRTLFGHNPAVAKAPPPAGSAYVGGVRFFVEHSAAMEPTLHPDDRISAVTRYAALHRGAVVVFNPPAGAYRGPPVGPLVKRVIGLPGETISSSGNTVFINGRPLSEPYLSPGQPMEGPIATQVIPAGHYFVLGDDRGDSEDSRFFGPIAARSVIGIATAIVSPPSRAGPISDR